MSLYLILCIALPFVFDSKLRSHTLVRGNLYEEPRELYRRGYSSLSFCQKNGNTVKFLYFDTEDHRNSR